MIPEQTNFQQQIDGKTTNLYILKNAAMQVAITNYGARIVSILVPDSSGKLIDVALGCADLDGYKKDEQLYFGATIGRYGNRIANGKFSINGKEYALALNNGPNSLHGGPTGFHARVWSASQVSSTSIELDYLSADGEEGFPGELPVKVVYSLTEENGIKITYTASTSKPTVLNLTNHTYFNLNGEGVGDILDHALTINASQYNPVNMALIPVGIRPVAGTPFDFIQSHKIGERIGHQDEQLKNGNGYDHNFVLNHANSSFRLAATVSSPQTGIEMKVFTTEPGMQFYSGNFMSGAEAVGKEGHSYPFRTAFCLETQHFPDSPNQPDFPSVALLPGETYSSETEYRFSVFKI